MEQGVLWDCHCEVRVGWSGGCGVGELSFGNGWALDECEIGEGRRLLLDGLKRTRW